MVSRVIAKLLLGLASAALMLANYWFTFGLWPKSWLAFGLCTGASVTIAALYFAIHAEDK